MPGQPGAYSVESGILLLSIVAMPRQHHLDLAGIPIHRRRLRDHLLLVLRNIISYVRDYMQMCSLSIRISTKFTP
jgi:hypothetical protein